MAQPNSYTILNSLCVRVCSVCVCANAEHYNMQTVLAVKCSLGSLHTVKGHKIESYATTPQSHKPVALYEYS